ASGSVIGTTGVSLVLSFAISSYVLLTCFFPLVFCLRSARVRACVSSPLRCIRNRSCHMYTDCHLCTHNRSCHARRTHSLRSSSRCLQRQTPGLPSLRLPYS